MAHTPAALPGCNGITTVDDNRLALFVWLRYRMLTQAPYTWGAR